MSDQAGAVALPPAVESFLPSTFLERGVAVPFTTPQLAGARARPGTRVPLELVVPNPSGGRGHYILPWDGLSALCRPTLHDSRLCAAVAELAVVTPAAIRLVARAVASEGFAGRAARAAALDGGAVEEQARVLTNFDLLLELVSQVEAAGPAAQAAAQTAALAERPAEIERRAKRAVALIAPGLGRGPDAVAAALEQLAALFAPLGIGRNRHAARLPRLVARLRDMREAVVAHALANPDEAAAAGELVAAVADLTSLCAGATLGEAQALGGDIIGLLRRWIAAPEELGRYLARAEWVLDGWDHICALWGLAEDHPGRAQALAEMSVLLPVVPREAGDWLSQRVDLGAELQRHRRRVSLCEDWRSGATLTDLTARNEGLLAQGLLAAGQAAAGLLAGSPLASGQPGLSPAMARAMAGA